ncbi:hypothetical protein TSA1_34130 [Bradyrhizobium nitroreducens]|uniref:Uncharacterized protein n=1 Tax=Bradyrhizobium nitroreducens TaxID=709803 RepID=A0A2M6UKS8_9BRAD|nr:hypothetical protein TSA1_34130 [Bradyrhizobium nitroreducens]TQF42767.1 hypothetical protein UNPF46_04070 [Bradyrhizobium sp. UNPF46]
MRIAVAVFAKRQPDACIGISGQIAGFVPAVGQEAAHPLFRTPGRQIVVIAVQKRTLRDLILDVAVDL